MNAMDLRSRINTELESMPLSMLEKVSDFIQSLSAENASDEGITPLVASMLTGHSVDLSDTELNTMKEEYLKEKYQ